MRGRPLAEHNYCYVYNYKLVFSCKSLVCSNCTKLAIVKIFSSNFLSFFFCLFKQIKKYFELEPLARGKSWLLEGSTVDNMDAVKESFSQLIHLLEEKDQEMARIWAGSFIWIPASFTPDSTDLHLSTGERERECMCVCRHEDSHRRGLYRILSLSRYMIWY